MPAIPAALSTAADPALEEFIAIWRRVAAWDAADGLSSPAGGPLTVLAVTEDGLRRMTPCDVSDPFMVDRQLQRTLLGRHVLTELVTPGDGRFKSEGRAATLDGGEVTLSRLGDDPVFSYGGAQPAVAKKVITGDEQVVYAVDAPFVDCAM